MSKNGVWQLKKLVIRYCDLSGSSKYIRNILNTNIKEFKDSNPQIEYSDEVNRGKHPYLVAHYESGIVKQLPLRGREEDKIMKHILNLKESSGEKPRKFKDRYIKTTPSIQGLWNPFIEFTENKAAN
ncbi:hypothetical protein DLAC_10978 [Tieghemostelium lacteum]|uniref:Large ribosomal subunit protein mL43 n=1 Tax=Tieghemostelium lacteum TaxID=361077 RepID=A0A151Z2V3_TIELA|nr:hypothetical protein DLAC_10978 [Tieghemostelium lacteum]|eukprot:KYQ88286.1 hypothetical protein DLAC_10978 [Tieghemostelium lacteum]